MWTLVFAIAVILLISAFITTKLTFEAEYSEGSLRLFFSIGLLWGILPFSAELRYEKGRIQYSLPWVSVDESARLFLKELKKIKRKGRKEARSLPYKKILSAIFISRLDFNCIIGVKDAACCAILCGLIQGALYAALAPLNWKRGSFPNISVVPAFNRDAFSLKLEGIALLMPAQIISVGRKKDSYKVSAGG